MVLVRLNFLATIYILVAAISLDAQEPKATQSGPQARLASISELKKLEDGWVEWTNCPVFAIDSIDVPASESGLIADLPIGVSREVSVSDSVGGLDKKAALLEEAVAGVQAQVANAAARDESDVRFAEMILEEAKLSLSSYEQIQTRGSATDSEMRTKQLAVAQAELKVQHAMQTIEQMKLKSRLAQATVVMAKDRVERMRFKVPFDGTVSEIFKHQGEWIQAGQPVFRVIRLDELRVDCYMNPDQIDHSQINETPVVASLILNGSEVRSFTGKITHFDPSVSSTGELRVHATIQNQRQNGGWVLLPGMTVNLRLRPITAGSSANLLNINRIRR